MFDRSEPDPDNGFPAPCIIAEFSEQRHLTAREHEILSKVCLGLKNIQIARELGVSNATIRLHIGNIHRKLGSTSKVDLVLQLWQWSCRNGHAGRG